MSQIIIEQDYENDEGEIGGPLDVYWCLGHIPDTYSAREEFMNAVVQFCATENQRVPRIDFEEDEPKLLWQRNVEREGTIEYYRSDTHGKYAISTDFPVTVLDLERRRHGAQQCAVEMCTEPWSARTPMRVALDLGMDPKVAEVRAEIPLCREHSEVLPSDWYRTVIIPIGHKYNLEPIERTGKS